MVVNMLLSFLVINKMKACIDVGNTKSLKRYDAEIKIHLVLITLALISAVFFYYEESGDKGSVAPVGHLISPPETTQKFYSEPEVIAFLTKSVINSSRYNYINETTRLSAPFSGFSTDAQKSHIAFLSSQSLYPLDVPGRVSLALASVPTQLDFSSKPHEAYTWVYDVKFSLSFHSLVSEDSDFTRGYFIARAVVAQSQEQSSGYLLEIKDLYYRENS